MTDATTPEQPRTAAGRALLNAPLDTIPTGVFRDAILDAAAAR